MAATKTVLIAGGAGFLGSHLCDHYIQSYRVVCVDNLSTGSKRNVRHLQKEPKFKFYRADITKPLPSAVTKQHYQAVINMASPASPPQYQRLALATLQVGSQGTLSLLELARANRARFFHASTSEVYGDPKVHPQPESYRGSVNCYGPRSMYDEAKRYAEALIYSYQRQYQTKICLARIFNTYGPRMDMADGRVVSNFIAQALESKPLTIYGDGRQTRSFCYVSDLISGIIKLIDSGYQQPLNLGNPQEFTIKELAAKVLKLTGSKSPLKHLPLPADDPLQRRPVITKANRLLGWQPKVKLEDGLRTAIEYFQKLI
ncbi:SDR family oxidoreductase [Candidatus Microgenomates bacterium]|nr:SDR family oxidoreductase [Candidatus Microgenomates bacterium]